MSYSDYDFSRSGIRPVITSRNPDALIHHLAIGMGQEGDYLGDRLYLQRDALSYFDLDLYQKIFPNYFPEKPEAVDTVFPSLHQLREEGISHLALALCTTLEILLPHVEEVAQELRNLREIRGGIDYLVDRQRFHHSRENPLLLSYSQE